MLDKFAVVTALSLAFDQLGDSSVVQPDWKPAMPPRPHILYRACLLDSVGNLAEVRPFSAYGDEEAHNLALMMPNMFGIELWRGGALVETFPAAARLPAGSSVAHSPPC